MAVCALSSLSSFPLLPPSILPLVSRTTLMGDEEEQAKSVPYSLPFPFLEALLSSLCPGLAPVIDKRLVGLEDLALLLSFPFSLSLTSFPPDSARIAEGGESHLGEGTFRLPDSPLPLLYKLVEGSPLAFLLLLVLLLFLGPAVGVKERKVMSGRRPFPFPFEALVFSGAVDETK